MEITRLKAENYDQLLNLLNYVFSRKNNRQVDFEKDMPKMWGHDDEHMGKHLGIFEEGNLVACIGIYPFDVVVAGETLHFATTGNIAVHPDFEGRGYMGAMVDVAMAELDRMNIDIARLGGLRSRYNRYGFEACGQNFTFTFTEKNRLRKFPNYKGDITFKQIDPEDKEALGFTAELYNKNAIAVPRNAENSYKCLTMWMNEPYLALRNGEPIGYVCASQNKVGIAEFDAVDLTALTHIICAWQELVGGNISFGRQMHQVDSIRVFSEVCEGCIAHSPSHFKIINWTKVTDAFLKLKATYCKLMPGELKVEIEGYGTIRMFVDENKAGCEAYNGKPDITLDPISATRYVFGTLPPIYTADASPIAQSWFPLPLSWNGQDRV